MLSEIAKCDVESTLAFFKTTSHGLSQEEATKRLEYTEKIKWFINKESNGI